LKRNLLVLVLVLVAVAVGTRLTRYWNGEAEWDSLRQDETRCLEALWDRAPQVEIVPTTGGVLMNIQQAFGNQVPAARRSWTYEVARLVARRHPKVQLSQIRVVDATNGQEIIPTTDPEERTELLRRQRQSMAEAVLPGALVLLEIQWPPPPSSQLNLENRGAPPSARARGPHQGGPSVAPALERANSVVSAPPTGPVSSICWLITPTDPPPAVLESLKPLDRVVRLPNP